MRIGGISRLVREPCGGVWHWWRIILRELSVVHELLKADVVVILRVASGREQGNRLLVALIHLP